jgi:hypothetical protein
MTSLLHMSRHVYVPLVTILEDDKRGWGMTDSTGTSTRYCLIWTVVVSIYDDLPEVNEWFGIDSI